MCQEGFKSARHLAVLLTHSVYHAKTSFSSCCLIMFSIRTSRCYFGCALKAQHIATEKMKHRVHIYYTVPLNVLGEINAQSEPHMLQRAVPCTGLDQKVE